MDILYIKMAKNKTFTLVKRIAKHGRQAIIVVPSILQSELKPGTITQVTIEILEDQDKKIKEGKDDS